jgi:hypothetical protein
VNVSRARENLRKKLRNSSIKTANLAQLADFSSEFFLKLRCPAKLFPRFSLAVFFRRLFYQPTCQVSCIADQLHLYSIALCGHP